VTVQDLGLEGAEDINHLQRATEMGRVLCTFDADFIVLAQSGIEHAGIIIGHGTKHHIGEWVKGLALIHTFYSAEELINRLEFLP